MKGIGANPCKLKVCVTFTFELSDGTILDEKVLSTIWKYNHKSHRVTYNALLLHLQNILKLTFKALQVGMKFAPSYP